MKIIGRKINSLVATVTNISTVSEVNRTYVLSQGNKSNTTNFSNTNEDKEFLSLMEKDDEKLLEWLKKHEDYDLNKSILMPLTSNSYINKYILFGLVKYGCCKTLSYIFDEYQPITDLNKNSKEKKLINYKVTDNYKNNLLNYTCDILSLHRHNTKFIDVFNLVFDNYEKFDLNVVNNDNETILHCLSSLYGIEELYKNRKDFSLPMRFSQILDSPNYTLGINVKDCNEMSVIGNISTYCNYDLFKCIDESPKDFKITKSDALLIDDNSIAYIEKYVPNLFNQLNNLIQ